MHRYDKTLDYSPKTSLTGGIQEKDKFYKNFFSRVKWIMRNLDTQTTQKWESKEKELSDLFHRTKK